MQILLDAIFNIPWSFFCFFLSFLTSFTPSIVGKLVFANLESVLQLTCFAGSAAPNICNIFIMIFVYFCKYPIPMF